MAVLDLTQLAQLPTTTPRVLILGGQGRIGAAVAHDILTHTEATVIVTSRSPGHPAAGAPRRHHLALSLDDRRAVKTAIAAVSLVVHCAGPFSYRDHQVLDDCIALGVPYLDVADHPPYVEAACQRHAQAQAQQTIAIVGTGVFPGISNSLARQCVEALDTALDLRLDYVVAGSGGAGVTVMRTTFLEIQHPIPVWQEGQWTTVAPYSQREVVTFPPPYGRCGVYWFSTVEGLMLPTSFPTVRSVTTKFGSRPDVYNHLTWLMAHGLPARVLQRSATVEFLANVSYAMTQVTDRQSGTGLAIRVVATGQRDRVPTQAIATLSYPDTAIAAGIGTGSLAQAILSGQLRTPGVYTVEQIVPTPLFLTLIGDRQMTVDLHVEPQAQPQ